jgi:pimeloyl-ACP methyl ester carboxylesterase
VADPPAGDAPAWFTTALAVQPERDEVVVDGCPVSYLRWGSPARRLLVLQHGGASHAHWWSFIAPFFIDEWCVVAPELSGHGDSGWRNEYCLEQWAEEMLAMVDAVGVVDMDSHTTRAGRPDRPPASPIVVGHSLGSQVAAVAATRAPGGFGAVVLCDPPRGPGRAARRPGRHFQRQVSYPTRQAAIDHFKLIPRQPCDNVFAVRHVAETSVTEREGRWAWKFDWRLFARPGERNMREVLADVPTPVAFLCGALSAIATPDRVGELVEAYGRSAPVVWLPEAHHHVWLDQPLAFVTALRALLSGWADGPPGEAG